RESREYPVGENRELVDYAQRTPLLEILQHGTTHETRDGAFEYARRVPRGDALRGRQELERAFARPVRIFVPPHDWIGRSGVLAVEAAGMDIIRGRGAGLKVFIARFAYLRVFAIMLFFKLSYALRGKTVPAYPFILDFGKHREACSYRLEDPDVFAGLEDAHGQGGVFVVVTHLHFYTEEKKARLLALVRRARELDAEFVPPAALFA
ncbi:MAG: hypothetical protein KGI78_03705, partial [Patescibacteria group bacterium]|nr:hypothetical protein [Patescibacteria group bacterium]